MAVTYAKSEQQFNEVINSGKPVIVDFTASWCGPCKRIAPFFEKLAGDFPGMVFLKVDVDELDTVAAQCGIRAMPTFIVFKDGKQIPGAKLEGASDQALEELVKKCA